MVFTEEDAENDGKLKREAGQQLNSVLSRQNSKLYRKFMDWCDEYGRDPSKVLGDMILRAIRSEEFAEQLSNTVVDVGALQSEKVRKEDLELVTDMIDRLDEGDDSTSDPIDRLIEKRIEAVGEGPMGGIANQRKAKEDGQDREIRSLEKRIQRIERAVVDSEGRDEDEGQENVGSSGGDTDSGQDVEQSIDDLIDGTSDDNEEDSSGESDVEVEVSGDGVETSGSVDENSEESNEDESNIFSTDVAT